MPRKSYHHGDLKNALILAGIEILSKEGVEGLTLRKVAKKAGVSHAAPYAHFADKQALVAAISAEGFRRLYVQLAEAVETNRDAPQRMLVEVGITYLQFALDDPAYFKTMFSRAIEPEREKEYPEFVEMSKKNFQLLVHVVEVCQEAGLLEKEPADLMAVSLWGLVHGLVSLVIENQVSHKELEKMSLREMVLFSLNQITRPGVTLSMPRAKTPARSLS